MVSYFTIAASEEEDQGFIVCQDAHTGERDYGTDDDQFTNPFTSDAISNRDPVSEFMRSIRRSDSMSPSDPPELYLPGLVIHIVPQRSNFDMRIWKRWGVPEKTQCHKAYIADRESFKDMIVSPSMFLDHLPWRYQNIVSFNGSFFHSAMKLLFYTRVLTKYFRCHNAMLNLLQARSSQV